MTTTTKKAPRLTADQREALHALLTAGPAGIVREARWVAAASLVRRGLATAETLETNVCAAEYYARQGQPLAPRSHTHTVRGTPRRLTIVRFVAIDPTPPEAARASLRAMRAEALYRGDTATAEACHAELGRKERAHTAEACHAELGRKERTQ